MTDDAPGDAPSTRQDVGALVRELRATLDQIGDALVNGTFDDLIATESRLAGLAGGCSQVLGGPPLMPIAPSPELDAALLALRRCQRLGSSFTDVGTSWLGVGEANAYTRSGRSPARVSRLPRTTIDMRI